jgi:histidinol dehydrogenase
VIAVGGAQAIALLAYGTSSIARVDKIVGPGNAWVAAAKALVAADCAIDLHAGPSEVVVCSNTGRPDWIAADLLAQAEHDAAARALFVTTSRRLAREVSHEVDTRIASAHASKVAAHAIARAGGIVVVRSRREAIDLVNRIAPEHLMVDDATDADRFRAAGTIFVGRWSAEAAGDYCTGSNHVLPTGGAARSRGGLSAADFVRVFTVQTLTARGLRTIAPSVVALADAEGLSGHAESVRMRVREIGSSDRRRRPAKAGRYVTTPAEAGRRGAKGGDRATRTR